MEDLHAAIVAYLRRQRRPAEVRRPITDTRATRQLYGYGAGQPPAPRCQVCGRPVDDDGGLFDLADMRLRRQCAEHYCPF